VALRWRGRLRVDPLALPWERDLRSILRGRNRGGRHAVSGGLRVTSYAKEPNAAAAPLARAGDRVEVLVRALTDAQFR